LANTTCYRPVTGILIAFEGLDGSGVSTHSRLLASRLSRVLRAPVIYEKEPTYGPLGYLVWLGIRYPIDEGLRDPRILALLFAADRLWHLYYERLPGGVRGVIEALLQGYVVVMDRYKYSSIAYQSAAGADMEWVVALNNYAPPAHVLVYLDAPVEVAARRLSERSETHLYEDRVMLERVSEAYRRLLRRLEEEPEYPPPRANQYWRHIVPAVDKLYPSSTSYPVVIRVRVDDSKPASEVGSEIASRIIRVLCDSRLLLEEPC